MGNGNNIRDDKWTKSIAVGSKEFVEHVKSALGALAKACLRAERTGRAERPMSQETAISFERPQCLMESILGSKTKI